jgi:hypothetical protein
MKYNSLSQLPIESVSHNAAIRKKVMLRMGELPHLTNFAQAEFAPVVDGISHSLNVGTYIAIEAGEVHEVSNTGSELLVLTYFGIRV